MDNDSIPGVDPEEVNIKEYIYCKNFIFKLDPKLSSWSWFDTYQ